MGANQSQQTNGKRANISDDSIERSASNRHSNNSHKRSISKAGNKHYVNSNNQAGDPYGKSSTNVAAKLGLSWRKKAPLSLSRQENNDDVQFSESITNNESRATSAHDASPSLARPAKLHQGNKDLSGLTKANSNQAPVRKSLASVFNHIDGKTETAISYDNNNNNSKPNTLVGNKDQTSATINYYVMEKDINQRHNERAIDISENENRSPVWQKQQLQQPQQLQNRYESNGHEVGQSCNRKSFGGVSSQQQQQQQPQTNGSYYVSMAANGNGSKSNEICVTMPAFPKQPLADTQKVLLNNTRQQYLVTDRHGLSYSNGHIQQQQQRPMAANSNGSNTMSRRSIGGAPNGTTIHSYYYGNGENLDDAIDQQQHQQQQQLQHQIVYSSTAHSNHDPYCHSRHRPRQSATATTTTQQRQQQSQLDGCSRQHCEAQQQQVAHNNNHNSNRSNHRISMQQQQQQSASSLRIMPIELPIEQQQHQTRSINGPYDIVVPQRQHPSNSMQSSYQLSHAINRKAQDMVQNNLSSLDKINNRSSASNIIRHNNNTITSITSENHHQPPRHHHQSNMSNTRSSRVLCNDDDYGFDTGFGDYADTGINGPNRPLSLSQNYSPYQKSVPLIQRTNLNDSYNMPTMSRGKTAVHPNLSAYSQQTDLDDTNFHQYQHHQRVPSITNHQMFPQSMLSPPVAAPEPLLMPTTLPHHNRSYSVGSSLTLDSSKSKKGKKSSSSMNPFAGLFGGGGSSSANRSNNSSYNRLSTQANTIHLSSSNRNRYTSPQQQASKSMFGVVTSSSNNGQRSAPGSLKRTKASNVGTLFGSHQASHEAMRTIDMYLIRQIARSCMDFDMEQKIDLEIRLHELAAQSMLEARDEIEALEVEKSLLASEQRMNCYAAQLEERRKLLSSTTMSTTSGDSGRGSKLNVGSDRSQDNARTRHLSAASKQSSGGANHKSKPENHRPPRSDVIGEIQSNESILASPTSILTDPSKLNPTNTNSNSSGSRAATSSSSPSQFSSLSGQSPSKLSPVFDQSANSPTSSSQLASSAAASSANDNSSNSSNSIVDRHSRSRDKIIDDPSNHSPPTTGRHLKRTVNVRRSRQKPEHQQQQQQSKNNIRAKLDRGAKVTISVGELRIPLMWRDVDHFKNRGDYKRYAVFCLLKIDSQIYDTQLISDVDRQVTDVNFDDVITFSGIEQNFELTIEVYSCLYLEQFSFSSTPRKLKEKLSNSVSRAMGRRLATQTASTNYIKELQAYDRSHRFALIATATLRLDDASDSVKTYDFKLISPSAHNRHQTGGSDLLNSNNSGNQHHLTTGGGCGTLGSGGHSIVSYYSYNYSNTSGSGGNSKEAQRNTLPLFGHFCCKLHVQADKYEKKAGY